MAAAGSWRRDLRRISPSMPGGLRSRAQQKGAAKNCSAATPAKPCSSLPRVPLPGPAECGEHLLVQVRLPSAPGCGTAKVSSHALLKRSPTPPPPSPFLSAVRGGGAHAPSPDVRCGPPGLSLTRKSAALRHPWLRWPPTPAHGARAPPPRTSIRKSDGGSVMEAEGSANARGAHATRLLPSRSRCATEVERAGWQSRSRGTMEVGACAAIRHASARKPQPLAAVAAAGDPLEPRGVGQIPCHRLLDP